jgi:hypothetical protein
MSDIARSKSAPGALASADGTSTNPTYFHPLPNLFPDSTAHPVPTFPTAGPVRTIDHQLEPNDDLGVPGDDIKDPEAYRELTDLVDALMALPKNHNKPKDAKGKVMQDRVQVRLDWVKKTVSEKHFIFDESKGRSVLRDDSKIRTHGKLYGLPKRYYDFLCGNDLDPSVFKDTRDPVWMTKQEFIKVCLLSDHEVDVLLTIARRRTERPWMAQWRTRSELEDGPTL